MNNANFTNKRQEAIKQMKEMNARSIKPEPEKPPGTEPQKPNTAHSDSLFKGLNLPFLENLKTDSDLTLILGILLLLLSEKADKRLLFALIYILL